MSSIWSHPATVVRRIAGAVRSAKGRTVTVLVALAAAALFPAFVRGQEDAPGAPSGDLAPAVAPAAPQVEPQAPAEAAEPAPAARPRRRAAAVSDPGAQRAAIPAPAAQQAATPAGAPQEAADLDSLLAQVRQRFQVYPLRDGVLLLPKYAAADVQSVQVAGGTIAINGRASAGGEIASLLGQDAPLVLRLSYVPPEQLAERAAASAAPPDTGVGPGAPQVGAIVGADTATAGPAGVPGAPGTPEVQEPPEPPIPPEMTYSGDVVRMGGDITIAEGETVGGDVVSIGGSVDVAGQILGDAVSVGGVLRLQETARVLGDAVSVGGRMEKAPGAYVGGETSSVGMSVPFVTGRSFAWDGGGMFGPVGGLLVTFLWIALLLILGSIFILFLNRPLDRVETNLRSSPLKAGLVGFLAQVLFLPAYIIGLVLLVITIIGIPIAVIWAIGFFIVGILAALFGFTAAARATGHFVSNRWDRPLHSPYIALFVGLLVLFVPTLLGNLFNFGPGLMDLFSLLFMILGCLVIYLAFTIGFGAVILTRFGTRSSWSGEPPAGYAVPTTPPPPPAPPADEPFPEPVHRVAPELPSTRLAGESGGSTLAADLERPALGADAWEPVLGGEREPTLAAAPDHEAERPDGEGNDSADQV
jgi:hypothetical protein